jgi:uncharacterized membrane protein
MIAPAVFWPNALGCAFFVAGLWTYRREVFAPESRSGAGVLALGPVCVAAALAAFAGEHFTITKSLAAMVPKFMPARLFIAYFVGVAHLAAALSFVARRCLRWSTLLLGIMFALFVLLLHFPGAIRNPGMRIAWIVTVRETTFSLGALSFFATLVRDRWPRASSGITAVARVWSGLVITYYGFDHFLHPQFSPGVPDSTVTASWVPLPHMLAYAVGTLLIVFGITMVVTRYAASAAKYAGVLMLVLTAVLYVPQSFLARGVELQITALNFVFDTLLFGGTMLVIARAILISGDLPAVHIRHLP